MTFRVDQVEAMNAPLKRDDIKSRSQAGRKFSYIEGWHAIAEANRIFGFDGWDRELISMKQERPADQIEIERENQDGSKYKVKQWYVGYTCTVRIHAGNRFRDGTGYGSGVARDLGDAIESAVKEAETDAMKRALITFGWPFGLALYDKDQENVENTKPPAKAPPPPPPRPISERAAPKPPDDDFPGDRPAPAAANTLSANDMISQFSDFSTTQMMDAWNSDQDIKTMLLKLDDDDFERVKTAWKNKRRIIAAKEAKKAQA